LKAEGHLRFTSAAICGRGQPVEIFMNGHAERRQHGQIPVHGVRVKRFSRNGEVVKTARAFADFVEADEKFSAREPRERTAAREALQVNDEIEFLFAEPADAAEHFRPVLRLRPAFAFEADDAGQVGIAFEQRRERGINPPENFRVVKCSFNKRRTGSAWITSPSELGLRIRIFK
jgi:hypothetical protein